MEEVLCTICGHSANNGKVVMRIVVDGERYPLCGLPTCAFQLGQRHPAKASVPTQTPAKPKKGKRRKK